MWPSKDKRSLVYLSISVFIVFKQWGEIEVVEIIFITSYTKVFDGRSRPFEQVFCNVIKTAVFQGTISDLLQLMK